MRKSNISLGSWKMQDKKIIIVIRENKTKCLCEFGKIIMWIDKKWLINNCEKL